MGRDAEESHSWSKELSAGPRTAAEARWFLREALADQDVDLDTDAAMLLASEVASNAAKHGREPIALSISIEEQGLRVSVFDRGEGFDPESLDVSGRETGGWGLRLLNDLSSEWGVDRKPDGTEVWFRV
jgi:anti-sigma regulatory factor (Ser/Thr protein kinase)